MAIGPGNYLRIDSHRLLFHNIGMARHLLRHSVLRTLLLVFALFPSGAAAQLACAGLKFLTAPTVNLRPTATSHIDVIRQPDGSYTGFEVTDGAPYRVLAATPRFEQQWTACLPHQVPAQRAAAPAANPPGVGSQLQVALPLPSGNFFVASISPDRTTIHFAIFDARHTLISENNFQSVVSPPGYVGSANEFFLSLLLADVNLDGKQDLIAVIDTPSSGGHSYGGVWTFAGNGDGTFQAGNRQVLVSGALQPTSSAAVADLNGDGKPDLVLTAPDGGPLTVALGNGDGTFTVAPASSLNLITGPFTGPSSALADLNGDGKADLVVIDPLGARVAVGLGNGNGTFGPIAYYRVRSLQFPADLNIVENVAVGDVNGDGIPDIVTSSGSILLGDGKGGFPTRRDYAVGDTGAVMLGDFDGDGKIDIIFGNGNPWFLSGSAKQPALTVLLGQGGGVFLGAPVSAVDSDVLPSSVESQGSVAADFNGDGIPDFASYRRVRDNSGDNFQLTAYQGQGDGRFLPWSTQTFANPTYLGVSSVISGDFNRDGKPDLAVLLSQYPTGGELRVYPGKGDGTFGAPLILTLPNNTFGLIAGTPDLNGDGAPDLVLADANGVTVFLGKGDGTFSGPASVLRAVKPEVAFGDFNQDGKQDLAVVNLGTAVVSVYPGKGDGTFSSAVTSALPGNALGDHHEVAAADFDNDGKLDLAVLLGQPGNGPHEIAVLSGRGDGTFGPYRLSSGVLTGFQAVDFNGDQRVDLVGFGSSGFTAVLLGHGDGTFQPEVIVYPRNALEINIADFNHDGLLDVAGNIAGGGMGTLLQLPPAPQSLAVVSSASFAPGPLAPNSIASGFGSGIALGSNGFPQPVSAISGLTVNIVDSGGTSRLAPLFFASPNQVNFLVPAGTASGTAEIAFNGTSSFKVLRTQVEIAPVSPALFTAGSGFAAAYAVHVAPGGMQSVSLVFASQAGVVVPVPVDLSQGGQTYLTLFGTGFDAAHAASTFATVQGLPATVTYAGPQGTYPGLDQVNLLLPAGLTGTGVAGVQVTVDDVPSNTVFLVVN